MSFDICRLCLFGAPVTFSLLDSEAARMLEKLTDIKVEPTDAVSSICVKCMLNLKLAYMIQQKFLQAQNKLDECSLNATGLIKPKEEPLEAVNCLMCGAVLDNSHLEQFCDLCNESFPNTQNGYLAKTTKQGNETIKKEPKILQCTTANVNDLITQETETPVENKKTGKDVKHLKQIDQLEKKGIGVDLAQKLIQLSTEVKTQPKDPPITYTCETCQRKFTNRRKYTTHCCSHSRRECPVCKKLVTTNNFTKHVKNHESKPHICEQCGKTYMSQEKLRGHLIYEHKGTVYECEDCHLTFKSRQARGKHRVRQHDGPKHMCETCGRQFLFAHYLKKHITITHMKMRPYICEFCKKGFSGRHALKTHRRQHTNETPYKCEFCGMGFRQNVSLKSHLKTKHNVVENVTCTCEVCSKGFSSAHALQVHMRCHK